MLRGGNEFELNTSQPRNQFLPLVLAGSVVPQAGQVGSLMNEDVEE